jgi:hypothetical protein
MRGSEEVCKSCLETSTEVHPGELFFGGARLSSVIRRVIRDTVRKL